MENNKKGGNLINKLLNEAPTPFFPPMLPVDYLKELTTNLDTMKLLNEANQKFGEYRGYLINLINPSLLISPLIDQEAVLSSKLEGTHATLEDLLKYDADVPSDVNRDEMKEVANYRNALYYALDKMSTISVNDSKLPLSGKIIKQMHMILLNNVRGESKNPGQFKRQQNYIVSANGFVFTPVPANLTDKYIYQI